MDELFKNEIPTWDSLGFRPIDAGEGEAWKHEPQMRLAKALYEQSREIYQQAKLFCETLSGELSAMTTELILSNALVIPPKIMAVAFGDLYVRRMENAAIIRLNAKQLREQVLVSGMMENSETEYGELLLGEIEKFRELFADWVASFEKDEFEDEWGVF